MSGWRGQAVPLLMIPAVLAGCQTPPGGRIAVDLPVLRTARLETPSPWNWWGVRGEARADEVAGRVQVTSLPEAAEELKDVDYRGPSPRDPDTPADGEPASLPPPVREPIPIENASERLSDAGWSSDGATPLRRHPGPAESDWILQP